MKNIAVISICLLCATNSRAADTLTTKLVNSAYLEIVHPTAKFYYLRDLAENPKFDKYDIEELKNENPNIINEIRFSDFISNIKHDTTKLHWRDFKLLKAKLVDNDPLIYSYSQRIYKYMDYKTPDSILIKMDAKGVIPVLVKPGMTKKQLNKAEKKATQRYESKPIEEKNYYIFSKPIFSNYGNYALISLDQ